MIKFRWETQFQKTELGEIPREWEVKKLKEFIIKAKTGGTPPTKKREYWNGEIPWVTSNHLKSLYVYKGDRTVTEKAIRDKKTPLAEKGVLLFGTRIGIGNVSIAGVDVAFNQDVTAVWLRGTICKEYLVRLLTYSFYQELLENIADGTTVGGLNRNALVDLTVIIPPLPEQRRIAAVLSWFDELVENKKRQNEILEKTAMALFKSWFVDFEPFRDAGMEHSEELGREVPQGWGVKPIGEVAEFVKGLSYRSNELVENEREGEIFITLKIFKRGGGFRPEYKFYRGERYSEEQITKDGDLVIALTDMTPDARVVGAPALVILPPNRDMGILSLDAAKLSVSAQWKEYLYLYLKDSQEDNASYANGVNVLHLNLDLFKSGKNVLIPPPEHLREFHERVEPLFRKIILNTKEIMLLRKVRDALLPLLVFGKLRVVEL